jgi:hypothetical protein
MNTETFLESELGRRIARKFMPTNVKENKKAHVKTQAVY